MKHTLLKSFVLLLLLALSYSQAVAGVEYVTVEVKGVGTTEKEAIYDALQSALEQVNGLQMSTKEKSSFESIFMDVDGKSSEITEEKLQQKVKTATKGTVRQYEILSKYQEPKNRRCWSVSLKVTIAKYINSQQINRIRLAVIPFKFLQKNRELEIFSTQITQNLVTFLTQTRKFAMLDREFSAEQQNELDFLKRDDVPVEEMARIGNRLGTDFIVTGKIEKLIHKTSSMTLKRTGRKIYTTICGVNASYRLINIATGQILSSDSFDCRKKVSGTACRYHDMVIDAATSFGKQITESIFPIVVVSVTGQFLTLGQGGKTIHVGQRFNLIKYGKKIVDPYTGESLGREEIPVGTIKIVAVQAKTSRAKATNLKVNIEKNFELGKFIIRAVKEKKSYKKVPQKQLKQRRDTSKKNPTTKKHRNKISDDDW